MSDDSDVLEMHAPGPRRILRHTDGQSVSNTNAASLQENTSILLQPGYFADISPFELSPASTFASPSSSTAGLSDAAVDHRVPTTIDIYDYSQELSRSSSAPIMNHFSVDHDDTTNSDSINPSIHVPASGATSGIDTRHSNSSVKHLTCFWWKDKGTCRYSAEECLYAHYDTGHYTDPPRQLIPGEPALAGRRLERAMHHLTLATRKSSASLYSMPASRRASRPATPGSIPNHRSRSAIGFSSPLASAPMLPGHYDTDHELARLDQDNDFLRNLVTQNGKEKAIMVSTIESLQADNKALKGEMDGLRKAQEQLLAERQGLHTMIQQMEDAQQSFGAVRNVSSPFGAIGRGRVNTESRYLGGLLTED